MGSTRLCSGARILARTTGWWWIGGPRAETRFAVSMSRRSPRVRGNFAIGLEACFCRVWFWCAGWGEPTAPHDGLRRDERSERVIATPMKGRRGFRFAMRNRAASLRDVQEAARTAEGYGFSALVV